MQFAFNKIHIETISVSIIAVIKNIFQNSNIVKTHLYKYHEK